MPIGAGAAPFICRCYFGLAQNAKTVIAITKNRDEGHLSWERLRRRCPLASGYVTAEATSPCTTDRSAVGVG